jgi:hypothetical protein
VALKVERNTLYISSLSEGGATVLWAISGFRREDENCALLVHYAASSGEGVPTFRESLSVPTSGDREVVPKSR